MGGYAFWFLGIAGGGAVSVAGVLGYANAANIFENKHGTCSISELPCKEKNLHQIPDAYPNTGFRPLYTMMNHFAAFGRIAN